MILKLKYYSGSCISFLLRKILYSYSDGSNKIIIKCVEIRNKKESYCSHDSFLIFGVASLPIYTHCLQTTDRLGTRGHHFQYCV